MAVPYAEVIGDPIAHSKSPLIHNFWLSKLGIKGEYRRCLVAFEQLDAYFDARRVDPAWRGCNVTMPHKVAVSSQMQVIDPEALAARAINTVIQAPDGRLIGLNTDSIGFIEPLTGLTEPIQIASVIGAGGAARAVLLALRDMGVANVTLINRSQTRAWEVAAEFTNVRTIETLSAGMDMSPTDLLVNATPLGTEGAPELSIKLEQLAPKTIIYDLVYHPIETSLLSAARAAGLATVSGIEMLLGQAAFAFEYFFGASAPREHDAELRGLLTR